MSIRLLKLRAWLKTRTNMFLRAAREPVLTVIVAPKPEPHAFDAWVCDHCDPEDLLDDLDGHAAASLAHFAACTNAPDLYDDPVAHFRNIGLL